MKSENPEPKPIERLWKLRFYERSRIWPFLRFAWLLLAGVFVIALLLRMAGCGRPLVEDNLQSGLPHWSDEEFWTGDFQAGDPYNPGDIIDLPDDDFGRRVVKGALNLYYADGTDLHAAADDLVEQFPSEIQGVLSFADAYKRLTISVDENRREQLRGEIRREVAGVRFVFDETVFRGSSWPNDPGFDDEEKRWPLEHMGADLLWEVTEGSPNVTIAVIDDMFETDHPEINAQIYDQWNTAEYNGNVRVYGGAVASEHGTHVASLVAGIKDNGVGIAGTAPECSLLLLQVGDGGGNMATSRIVDALFFAANSGATVINMSLGMGGGDDLSHLSVPQQERMIKEYAVEEGEMWDALFLELEAEGLTVVQAAGNSDILAGIDPMKRSEASIVVGAATVSGERSSFSNFGINVDVYAPGSNIYGAVPGEDGAFLDGTSMASPLVAGIVGLIKSVRPEFNTQEIKALLRKTGYKMSASDTRSGRESVRVCMSCLVGEIESQV